jgi:hypothetical protein
MLARWRTTRPDLSPFPGPASDWNTLRCRLITTCDPFDLLATLSRHFAESARPCDHTFARITTYFDADPQQALAVFQILEELDVRCDCEAFFVLRMLTR